MYSQKLTVTFLLLLILSGCSSNKKDDQSKPYSINPQNDTIFCFIKQIQKNGNMYEVELDRIDFLHAEEAQKAMIEDGLLEPGEWPLNDYYIRNKEHLIEKFRFDESVLILMQTYSFNEETEEFNWNQKISIDELINILTRTDGVNYINHPFNLIVNEDKIIQIKEQYIP
ncbi:MAG: hypothetical protein Q8N03_07770 [Ignavibacteria bacterium]|jgi:hypothetical protein|nr:hypothetical protein [Ignavibacteria bacterium]